MKVEHIALGAIALFVLMMSRRSQLNLKQREQAINQLTEFFDEPDLSYAKVDFTKMLKEYSPQQALNIVIGKGMES